MSNKNWLDRQIERATKNVNTWPSWVDNGTRMAGGSMSSSNSDKDGKSLNADRNLDGEGVKKFLKGMS